MSRVFQNIDPPTPSPLLRGEDTGHTRRAERGVGGQYFGKRETLDWPLTVIFSLRLYQLLMKEKNTVLWIRRPWIHIILVGWILILTHWECGSRSRRAKIL
jgi:hypothetical protein